MPLVLATDAGAEMRRSLGMAVWTHSESRWCSYCFRILGVAATISLSRSVFTK